MSIPDLAKIIYCLPWDDFVKIMDKDYDLVHTNIAGAIAKYSNILNQSGITATEMTESARLDSEISRYFGSNNDALMALFIILRVKFPALCNGLNLPDMPEEGALAAHNPDYRRADGKPNKLSLSHAVLLHRYFHGLAGINVKVSENEYGLLRQLSLDIHRGIGDAAASGRLHITGKEVFREVTRFNEIFSRYYHRKPAEIFKYYYLTAWTIYGRFITTDSRREFGKVLSEIFARPEYAAIYATASVAGGSEISGSEMENIFDYGTFEEQLPGNASADQRRVLAAAERARVCGMPLMIRFSENQFTGFIKDALEGDSKNIVFTLPMSGFTQDSEFLGRYMPDPESGQTVWCRGVLASLAEMARTHPDKRIYLILENIDSASGDLRLAFHQPLLEHKIVLKNETDVSGALKGEEPLPDNLQFVLTMHRDADISDESFMDRSAGCFIAEIGQEEMKSHLRPLLDAGDDIKDAIAKYLIDTVFTEVKKDSRLADKITLHDITQIAYYAAGRIKDNHIVSGDQINIIRNEAWLHLSSRFSPVEDIEQLDNLKKILGMGNKEPEYHVTIEDRGCVLSVGGIRLSVNEKSQFGQFLLEIFKADANSKITFAEALEGFVRKTSLDTKDYFLTEMEEKIFCLLARIRKYAPSKVVFLQGLPGGGKTTIAKVFSDVVGARQVEFTLNREVDLSLFRGGLGLNRDGGMRMNTARLWKEMAENDRTFIFNEADTRQFFLQWMWPQITGQHYRLGTEFPVSSIGNTDQPFDRLEMGSDQMYVFTGNVRTDLAPQLTAEMPATYTMELPNEEIYKRTELLFQNWARRNNVQLTGNLKKKAEELAKFYITMAGLTRQEGETFTSHRQITPRHLERFSQLFFKALKDKEKPDEAFNLLVEIMFCRMWDNQSDINIARGIVKGILGDRAPPETKKMLEFIQNYSLDTPLLIFDNGTVDFNAIRAAILRQARHGGGNQTVEHTVNLSRFHTKTSLIGGLSRTEGDSAPANKLGILSWLILQANLSDKSEIAWMTGYLNLDPQVAPILNEFYQTNWLQTEDILDSDLAAYVLKQVDSNGSFPRLSNAYKMATGSTLPSRVDGLTDSEKMDFARFLISYKPNTLEFVMISPSDEEIKLHAADVDRFFAINVAETINKDWIERYVKTTLSGYNNDITNYARSCAVSAWELYEMQREAGLYDYNRFGRSELDVFLNETKRYIAAVKKKVNPDYIKLLALHTLGSGLVYDEAAEEGKASDYRIEFLRKIVLSGEGIVYKREFVKEGGKVHFVIKAVVNGNDYILADQATEYTEYSKSDDYGRYTFTRNDGSTVTERLHAPLQGLLSQEASAILFRRYAVPVILEGDPGGGKTTSSEEISRICGRPHFESGMFRGIDLATCLGGPIMRGTDIVLNVLDRDADNHYLLDFLRVYSEGGSYVADEGRVSEAAGNLLEWLIDVSRRDKINVGDYHPGLEGPSGDVDRGDGYNLIVTQNYHFNTEGREPVGINIDRQSGKIRVDSVLSLSDAETLIRYCLEGTNLSNDLITKLAQLHINLSRFHPQRRMISPRDIIEVVSRLRGALSDSAGTSDEKLMREIYRSISESYLEGVLDDVERKQVIAQIREVFNSFNETKYNETLSPKHREESGISNVSEEDVGHWKNSGYMMKQAQVLDVMLSSKGREVMINQHEAGSGLDIVKLTCSLTGRRIDIFEGNAFVTARQMFEGESFVFDNEFDNTGRRSSLQKNGSFEFKLARGRIGRYMIESGSEGSVSPDKRQQIVIVIPNIDTIPASELVKLNRILTTRHAPMKNPDGKIIDYFLPNWVHIVAITSNIEALSSPFTNRFRKLAMKFEEDSADMTKVISDLFPSVTAQEAPLLMSIAASAYEMRQAETLTLLDSYFTPSNIFDLAMVIQRAKERDASDGINREDPLWYIAEAVHYVYLEGLCPEDRQLFENEIITSGLFPILFPDINPSTLRNYWHSLSTRIEDEMASIEYHSYDLAIERESFTKKPHYCENGIIITSSGGNINIITPARSYTVAWKKLSDGNVEKLSDGLSVRVKGDSLILNMSLIKRAGGWDIEYDNANLSRALPWQEMSSKEFMYPAASLGANLASLTFWQQPVKAASGKIIPSRVILMPGETGSGKTTVCNMLSHSQGIPVVRINPDRDMRDTNMTVNMSFNGQNAEMTVQDFLLSLGEVRTVWYEGAQRKEGQWKRINAAFPTSNRMRILVDEANITREVWSLLDPIARGEKIIAFECADATMVEVKLDTEVQIVLTYNPAELYGGTGEAGNRFNFPQSLSSKSARVYVGEPLNVYSRDEILKIIGELYRRGERRTERQAQTRGIAPATAAPGYFGIAEHTATVRDVKAELLKPMSMTELHEKLRKDFYKPETEKSDKPGHKIDDATKERMTKEVLDKFAFDKEEFEGNLTRLRDQVNLLTKDQLYKEFMRIIVRNFFNGSATGKIDRNLFDQVESLATFIDGDLVKILQDFYNLRAESEAISCAWRLDALSKAHDVYLKDLHPVESNKRYTIYFEYAVSIKKPIGLDASKFKSILDDDYELVFPDDTIPNILVIDQQPSRVLAYYDPVRNDLIAYDISEEELLLEVASHELGHRVSEQIGLSASRNSRHFSDRLDQNIELYSVLFPIFFVKDKKKYIQNYIGVEAQRLTTNDVRPNDTYALAAKEILNAFAIKFGISNFKSGFNEKSISEILKKILSLKDEEIFNYCKEFFHDPQKYFPNVERGAYYHRTVRVNINGSMKEIALGEQPRFAPNVDVEHVGSIDVDVPDIDGGREIVDDTKDPHKKMETITRRQLPAAVRYWMNRYAKLFARDRTDALEMRTVPNGGVAINPQGVQERNPAKMFFAPRYESEQKGIVQNVLFVVDTSGSITGNPVLKKSLEDMIYQHCSLLLELSSKNPDLNVAVAAISGHFETLFNFEEWKRARTRQSRRKLIEDSLAQMWYRTDGGGIATTAILDAVNSWEFPMVSGKRVHNLILVCTDGEESGGRSTGDNLKGDIRKFREGKYTVPNKPMPIKSRPKIDMVFIGLGIGREGVSLPKNYPCHLVLPGQVSGDKYLEALFKIALLQTKKRLDGDLQPNLAGMKSSRSPSTKSAGSSAKLVRPVVTTVLAHAGTHTVNMSATVSAQVTPHAISQADHTGANKISIENLTTLANTASPLRTELVKTMREYLRALVGSDHSNGPIVIRGIHEEVSRVDNSARNELIMALRSAVAIEGLGDVMPGSLNIVAQIVPIGKQNGAVGINRVVEDKLVRQYNGASAKSIIKEMSDDDSEGLAALISQVRDALSEAQNNDKARALLLLPACFHEMIGAALKKAGVENDKRIRIQFIDQGDMPDLVSQFELGIELLEYFRNSKDGQDKKIEPSWRLQNLIAAMVEDDRGPKAVLNDILRNILYTLKIRRIDWRTASEQHKAWQAVAQSM